MNLLFIVRHFRAFEVGLLILVNESPCTVMMPALLKKAAQSSAPRIFDIELFAAKCCELCLHFFHYRLTEA